MNKCVRFDKPISMTDIIKPAAFKQYQNVSISSDVHKQLVEHTQINLIKIGKWVERAILNQLKKEGKKNYPL